MDLKLISHFLRDFKKLPYNQFENAYLESFHIPVIETCEYTVLETLSKAKVPIKEKVKYFQRNPNDNKFFLSLANNNFQEFSKWWNQEITNLSQQIWNPVDSNKIIDQKVKLNTWVSGEISEFDNVNDYHFEPKENQKKLKKNPRVTRKRTKNKKSKTSPNSCISIRLYPNKKQKQQLNLIFSANRWAYNLLVEKTKNKLFSMNESDIDKYRPLIQKKTMKPPSEMIHSVNEQAFDAAFQDLIKARNTTLSLSIKQKEETGKGFHCKLKYRKKKKTSQSIPIRSRDFSLISHEKYKIIRFWSKFFNFKTGEGILIKDDVESFSYSVRLKRSKTGNFFLCVPRHKEFQKTENKRKSCSIDPGVRTFLTGYDPDGYIFEFGKNLDKVMKRNFIIDKLKSRIKKFKNRREKKKRNQAFRLKREKRRIEDKIKRVLNDCHQKLSKWLSQTYDKILYPSFNVQEMIKKENNGVRRKISKTTARKLQCWKHYAFKTLLEYKMEREGGKLIECTEEYTSKTCTKCGRLNHYLGGSKIFKCINIACNIELDRDINGSRNIYLKNQNLLVQ